MKHRRRYEGLHVSGRFHAPQIGLPNERVALRQAKVKEVTSKFTDGHLAELARLLQGAKA